MDAPRPDLAGFRILLGVSGGIAAYKAPDLVRRLAERGATVQVVMTEGAKRFITPLTLQAVSGRPVRDSLWDEAAEAAMGHIELARWADAIVVAPATAELIARLAQGRADDLITTLCRATDAPLMLAPAMNRLMWDDPATRSNAQLLTERGVSIIGPGQGDQACGEVGPGRMLEPGEIADAVSRRLLGHGPLSGQHVVITAGPTREPVDPVRFLSNRSSGRMGYALAEAARIAGARVSLVSGPTALEPPRAVDMVRVGTAEEMAAAVGAALTDGCLFIACAAVADYRPATAADRKLKRDAGASQLDLVPTADVLAGAVAHDTAPFTVGFAAETDDVEANARAKLERKGVDMIAANRVGADAGFDRSDNSLVVYWNGGERDLGSGSKEDLARDLIALIVERRTD